MIITGSKPLYADYLGQDERLSSTIENLYKEINDVKGDLPQGTRYLNFALSAQIKSTGDEAITPTFRYVLN